MRGELNNDGEILTVSGALGDEGLTEGLGGEGDGGSEVVPFLSGKGVDSSLLGALLTTTSLQTRILTLSHFYFCSFFVLCFIIFNYFFKNYPCKAFLALITNLTLKFTLFSNYPWIKLNQLILHSERESPLIIK